MSKGVAEFCFAFLIVGSVFTMALLMIDGTSPAKAYGNQYRCVNGKVEVKYPNRDFWQEQGLEQGRCVSK